MKTKLSNFDQKVLENFKLHKIRPNTSIKHYDFINTHILINIHEIKDMKIDIKLPNLFALRIIGGLFFVKKISCLSYIEAENITFSHEIKCFIL